MVDEESQNLAAEPAVGKPANRDRREDARVIDGEISASETSASEQAAPSRAEPSQAEPVRRAAAPAPRPKTIGSARAFVSGALGGLVVAGLAAAGAYYGFTPKAELAEADANRLAAVEAQTLRIGAADESQAQRSAAGVANLDKRVGAIEAGVAGTAALGNRVDALEQARASEEPKLAAVAKGTQDLTDEIKALRADVDAARGEIPGFSARVAKLEQATAQAAPAGAELSALTDRIGKVETALAAPKTETRAAPEKPAAEDNPAAVAIVADVLRDKLAAGSPFATELAALRTLGVDPDKLTALGALVNGAPTARALADRFDAAAPKVLAAIQPVQDGGIADRFLAHLRGLVQVRPLNEVAGDDPAALVSQIEADSRRGDLEGALAAYAKLPETARRPAADWAAAASAKQGAEAALGSIREAAVARLAGNDKP
jgi:hypothetical protein